MLSVLLAVPSAVVVPHCTRRAVVSAFPLVAALPAIPVFAADEERFSLALPPGFVRRMKIKATEGTVFVGGNFPRAAIVSVTVWPIDTLLQNDAASQSLPGLPAAAPRSAAAGTLAQIADTPEELVKLLLRARDREANNGALQSRLLGYTLSDDKLRFSFDTPLPVADPDELEKQRGVRQLIRRTSATATLGSIPGSGDSPARPAVVSVWGSALTQDFDGDLGPPIQASVDSFRWTG